MFWQRFNCYGKLLRHTFFDKLLSYFNLLESCLWICWWFIFVSLIIRFALSNGICGNFKPWWGLPWRWTFAKSDRIAKLIYSYYFCLWAPIFFNYRALFGSTAVWQCSSNLHIKLNVLSAILVKYFFNPVSLLGIIIQLYLYSILAA